MCGWGCIYSDIVSSYYSYKTDRNLFLHLKLHFCLLQFWNCPAHCHFLLQVRRGVDRADIYNIALSPNVQWLAVSSDKGTVHIFSLRVRGFGDHRSTDSTAATGPISYNQSSSNALEPLITRSTSANPSSSFSFLKGENFYTWTYPVLS